MLITKIQVSIFNHTNDFFTLSASLLFPYDNALTNKQTTFPCVADILFL